MILIGVTFRIIFYRVVFSRNPFIADFSKIISPGRRYRTLSIGSDYISLDSQ